MLLNGQIMPGDVDRFRFRARQGQQLVIETPAPGDLIPYLADAVPGWFQATLALYDAEGNEVAFADDYRFHPDPVLFFEVPEDGEYELEIRDAIYRGREDFVYRITVGECRSSRASSRWAAGPATATAAVDRRAGTCRRTSCRSMRDTGPGDPSGSRRCGRTDAISNRVPFAVDTLPECLEAEPNDTPTDAQPVTLPRIVNGRIDRPGDVDVFRFDGRAGDEMVAEVTAGGSVRRWIPCFG